MRNIFLLCMLLVVIYGKESKIPKDKTDKTESESDKKSDGSYAVSNQCCSTENPECCVSLTYVSSSSKEEDVPEEFGGVYYCETMDLSVSDECGNLDYIVLPLSKSCDLTRTVYDLRGSKDFKKCEKNEETGVITINNAAEYLLSADDEENPTGLSALKFPLDESSDDQQITICTQLEWGQIVNKLDDKEIEIGFSVDNDDRFKCKNETIRDICSIDTSSISYNAKQVPQMIVNLGGMKSVNNADDPRVDGFIDTFEYYWNQWVGFGIAVFAASIFFNMVMCIYWSGLVPRGETGKSIMDKKMKVMIDDGDDETEEESDDTDESTSDQDDQHI